MPNAIDVKEQQVEIDLKDANIAIIGGKESCKTILEILSGIYLKDLGVRILAVANPDDKCQAMVYARKKGLVTTTDFSDVYALKELDLIIKLIKDDSLTETVEAMKPAGSRLIDLDHFQILSFINYLKTEEVTLKVKKEIRTTDLEHQAIEDVFNRYSQEIIKIAGRSIEQLQIRSEDLIESEKELSQIIHGSMIPTFVINNDHIITHWNKACEQLTGYNAYELIGTDRQWVPFRSAKRPTMADVIVDELDQEKIQRYYGKSWKRSSLIPDALEAEEFFPHLGEGGKWIFFTASPIKSQTGNIIGAIETLRDTTEDKQAQEELNLQDQELSLLYDKYRKSEQQYRSLFNNNPNPIFIIDSGTLEILDLNRRVEEEYGYTKNELLGKPYQTVGDPDDGTVAQELKGLSKNKSMLFTKRKHYKKDRKSFFVNVKVKSSRYSHRDVLIASATDISESVEKETQLIQAGKMATLGTMAAGMAHEINQPLNVIQICADLLLKMMKKGISISDEDLSTMAKDIIDNVARAAGVIKHVRDFARQSDRDLKKLSINEPLNDVFKVLGHQLANHQIEVELDLDPDIPDIMAEHNRLEQVFINLVTNAIDSMDEKSEASGGQEVKKLLTIKTFVQKKFVVATVTDTGLGMTKEIKNKIFEPFFTTKETGKGTGLGTSISFGIIKDYNGSIAIDSIHGEGATFIIKFPFIS